GDGGGGCVLGGSGVLGTGAKDGDQTENHQCHQDAGAGNGASTLKEGGFVEIVVVAIIFLLVNRRLALSDGGRRALSGRSRLRRLVGDIHPAKGFTAFFWAGKGAFAQLVGVVVGDDFVAVEL